MILGELCDLVAGRATLVMELKKSRFDGDQRVVARAADVLSSYRGAAALMSFDPVQIAALRAMAPKLPRGMVAENRYRDFPFGTDSGAPSSSAVWPRSQGTCLVATRKFIADAVRDLPATIPLLARKAFGLPLLTWTVRSAEDRGEGCALRRSDDL